MKKQSKKLVFYYVVLILLTLASLFPFYVLIINATSAHADIQKGFSIFPGGAFVGNLRNVLLNENLPVLSGIRNSLFIAGMGALFSTYFSSLTAYAIHAYEFKFKK